MQTKPASKQKRFADVSWGTKCIQYICSTFASVINSQSNFFICIFTLFFSSLSTLFSPELPSVSLLQKTPSSPVSCLATGFYPHRASLVWRKDGEELHEEVDHGEILPNHDGTFQMSVDLNLSSVTPEDWTRYDCVFQLYGVKVDTVTKLERDRIRTNWGKSEIRGCRRRVHTFFHVEKNQTVIINLYCNQQRSTIPSSPSLLHWLFLLSLSLVLLDSLFTKRRKVREKKKNFCKLISVFELIFLKNSNKHQRKERQSGLNKLSTNRAEWVEEKNKVTKDNLAFTTLTSNICLLFIFLPLALHFRSKTYISSISADLILHVLD